MILAILDGGGYGAGQAGADFSPMARTVGGGFLFVTIQYRLGVFGFLSHPTLSAEGGGASGNYALMDLIAALKWVR